MASYDIEILKKYRTALREQNRKYIKFIRLLKKQKKRNESLIHDLDREIIQEEINGELNKKLYDEGV